MSDPERIHEHEQPRAPEHKPEHSRPTAAERTIALLEVLLCSDYPTQLALGATLIVLGWAPVAGTAEYVVEVGSTAGSSDLVTAPVGGVTSVGTDAPPGVYYVRVRARNSCGTSGASNEVVVTVR